METVRVGGAEYRTCEEHGSQSVLPCAWPNCPNGTKGEEFAEEKLFAGQKVTRYIRREWVSPLGGKYYGWDSSSLPNYFFVRQTFWNEARRLKLATSNFPKVVYHYTSIEGFIGIASSRSVWMTDYSYLNDHRELMHGADIVQGVIGEIAEAEVKQEILQLVANWSSKLAEVRNRICITSFSSDDDSLSQWRAYGPIAIGFPVHPLALHVNQAILQPIIYDPEVQRKLIRIYLHQLCCAYRQDTADQRLDGNDRLYETSENMLELISFFKDPAFRTENEIRLAYIDRPEFVEHFGNTAKSFRVAKGRIVPYISSRDVLPNRDRNFELKFAHVVLGPECDSMLERGMREFLDSQGLVEVDIRRSAVPLR
jgi:hypothetical protein